jgi:hypothetical protein
VIRFGGCDWLCRVSGSTLELRWADLAQGGVAASLVIEHLDVIEQGPPSRARSYRMRQHTGWGKPCTPRTSRNPAAAAAAGLWLVRRTRPTEARPLVDLSDLQAAEVSDLHPALTGS